MRPLKPRNRAPSSYPEPSPSPSWTGLEGAGTRSGVGEGESAGCCRAARGKPISQIIGLDPTVVPRYPAFIWLPDWGRGAGRRRRGSNYGCSSPVAGRWRRAGQAGRGGDRVRRNPGRPLGRGTPVPRAAPALRPGPAPHTGSSAPPAQLPHCLLWSLRSPFPSLPSLPPSLPLPSPLLTKERRASLWRRMSHE